MRDDRRNIFNDGRIVATIPMPVEIFKGWPHKKAEWAEDVLGDHISEFHGRNARYHVFSNLTRDGRTTGTKATFLEKGKEIVYMIMEPKVEKQPGPDGKYRVHIMKAEYSENKEATIVDRAKQRAEVQNLNAKNKRRLK
jgi:hypothetical protein